MQTDPVRKRLAYGIKIFFILFNVIVSIGYLFDIVKRDLFVYLPDIINWIGVLLNTTVLILFLINRISIKVGFAVLAYTLTSISVVSSVMLLPGPLAYHYFMRDLFFLLIVLVFISLILGYKHVFFYTMGYGFFILIFTLNSDFTFLKENLVLIEGVLVSASFILSFLKQILDNSIDETTHLLDLLKNKNQDLEVQNELFKEQSFELSAINESLIRKEKSLKQNEEELIIANQTKNKMISIIAHDLKDSIALLYGSSGFLHEKFDSMTPEKRKDFINIIFQGSHKLDELLQNLLQWSKSQSQRISFTSQSIALHTTVTTAIKHNDSKIIQKQIKIKNSIPYDILIEGDEQLLIIVFRNLISNAIKFSPEGGAIEITTVEFAERYFIEVIDQGIGMDKEQYKNVFQIKPGEQRDGTFGEKGMGLGLSLCKEFVEMHGGKIGAKPNIPMGSIFWFTLPKKK